MKNVHEHALILDAGPNGLGAVRSLHKADVKVDVIAMNAQGPALLSSIPQRKVVLASPYNEAELLELLILWPQKGLVLIPTSDFFVNFVHKHQQLLEKHFSFVLPKGSLSSSLIDKKEEVSIVSNYVNLPKTIIELPLTGSELLNKISLPIIIKPRSNELNYLGKKNIQIYTSLQLDNFYDKYSPVLQYCIVQELIEGDDSYLWVCNCTFDEHSNLVNAFTFQRLQLTPPHFGVTCYAQSKRNNDVLEQVKTLGKGLGYIGPAMVEFKFDDRDGLYKYIEINPRLGLCNYFDTCCGKNNVYATYCVAKNIEFVEKPQKNGRMFLSLYEDLYSRFRDGQSIFPILKIYLSNIAKEHTFMYFAWRDPWPAIVMFYRQGKRTFKSIINKVK
jgi:predicted ATP-grasp superfamily ATP-dependent carboligase